MPVLSGFLFVGTLMNVIFLIDGFNLYHSISSILIKYKWLNLRSLAEKFTTKNEVIKRIIYFTSLATWAPDKMQRHRLYIKALEHFGVEVIFGTFRLRTKKCSHCKKTYETFEEKQTDVNIAITLLRLAIENQFDKAYIISGDSDLIPSVQAVKLLFPAKQIGIIIPIGRSAEELKNICDFYMRIKEKHLATSLLPDPVKLSSDFEICCPDSWK